MLINIVQRLLKLPVAVAIAISHVVYVDCAAGGLETGGQFRQGPRSH